MLHMIWSTIHGLSMFCCLHVVALLFTLDPNDHDDVIKWKHLPRFWPFVRGIHRSPVNSPHKGQWRGALMFSLICAWINGWVNNREAGDLRSHRAHYIITVMQWRKRNSYLLFNGFASSQAWMIGYDSSVINIVIWYTKQLILHLNRISLTMWFIIGVNVIVNLCFWNYRHICKPPAVRQDISCFQISKQLSISLCQNISSLCSIYGQNCFQIE